MFKSSQTRLGVSPVWLECKTKRVIGIACLGNRLLFHTELFEFLEKGILKIGLFSGQEVLQIKPNLVWSILTVGRLWDKKNDPPNFHGVSNVLSLSIKREVSISYGTFWISLKRNFKNRPFLSGQEVLQIKPNLVGSILRVSTLWDKKNGPPKLHRKNFVFQSEISTFSLFLFSKI